MTEPPAPPARAAHKGYPRGGWAGGAGGLAISVKTRNDLVQIRNLLTIGTMHALGERGFDELIDIPIQNRRRV